MSTRSPQATAFRSPHESHRGRAVVGRRSVLFSIAIAAVLATLGSAQVIPAAAPYVENFDGFAAPITLAPTAGSTGLGAEWNFQRTSTLAGGGVVSSAQFPLLPPPHGVGGNGTTFVRLTTNSLGIGATETATLALHFDGLQANSFGFGFTIGVMLASPAGSTTDPFDVVALVDGATPGNAITRTGAFAPSAGYLGFREALLLDWKTTGIDQNWMYFEFRIDTAFLAARGLTRSQNMALVLKSSTSASGPVSEDLFIDHVLITPIDNADLPFIAESFNGAWNGVGNGTNVLPRDWIQETTDGVGTDFDALVRTAAPPNPDEPTNSCSPVFSTTDYRLLFDDSSLQNNVAKSIYSAKFSLTSTNCLRFCIGGTTPNPCAQNSFFVFLHEYNASGAQIASSMVAGPITNLAPGWTPVSASLSPTSNLTTSARIRFQAQFNNGTSCKHNFYVDDIVVTSCFGGGQPPVPPGGGGSGAITLDFNESSFNTLGLGVGSFTPGPYFAAAIVDAINEVEITGTPGQPAILIAADLFVGSAVLVGIGQLDLNPGNLTVVGNFVTDANGRVALPFFLPGPGPYTFRIGLQAAVYDPAAPLGIFLTNAVEVAFP